MNAYKSAQNRSCAASLTHPHTIARTRIHRISCLSRLRLPVCSFAWGATGGLVCICTPQEHCNRHAAWNHLLLLISDTALLAESCRIYTLSSRLGDRPERLPSIVCADCGRLQKCQRYRTAAQQQQQHNCSSSVCESVFVCAHQIVLQKEFIARARSQIARRFGDRWVYYFNLVVRGAVCVVAIQEWCKWNPACSKSTLRFKDRGEDAKLQIRCATSQI